MSLGRLIRLPVASSRPRALCGRVWSAVPPPPQVLEVPLLGRVFKTALRPLRRWSSTRSPSSVSTHARKHGAESCSAQAGCFARGESGWLPSAVEMSGRMGEPDASTHREAFPIVGTVPAQAPKKAVKAEGEGEGKPNTTIGPGAREGENVFGVAHIFASFNDTFVVRIRRTYWEAGPLCSGVRACSLPARLL